MFFISNKRLLKQYKFYLNLQANTYPAISEITLFILLPSNNLSLDYLSKDLIFPSFEDPPKHDEEQEFE